MSNTSTGLFDAATFFLFIHMFFHVCEDNSVDSSSLPLPVKFSQELSSESLQKPIKVELRLFLLFSFQTLSPCYFKTVDRCCQGLGCLTVGSEINDCSAAV